MSKDEKLISKVSEVLLYLRLDHKNSISYLDNESLKRTTNFLSTILSSIKDSSPGKEINKLFNKILPENSMDILSTNKMIANEKNYSIPKLTKAINNILNKKPNAKFTFEKNDCHDIKIILSYSYRHLSNKIKTYENLLAKIDELFNSNTNLFKRYIIKSKERKSDLNNNDVNSINNNLINDVVNETTYVARSIVYSVDFNSQFAYDYYHKSEKKKRAQKKEDNDEEKEDSDQEEDDEDDVDIDSLEIPIEMLTLSKTFQIVRKLKFQISKENLKKDKHFIHNIIFILLNIQWIFPNAIELEVDFTNVNLYKDLSDVYYEQLIDLARRSKINIRNTLYDTGYRTKRNFNVNNSFIKTAHESSQDNLLVNPELSKQLLFDKTNIENLYDEEDRKGNAENELEDEQNEEIDYLKEIKIAQSEFIENNDDYYDYLDRFNKDNDNIKRIQKSLSLNNTYYRNNNNQNVKNSELIGKNLTNSINTSNNNKENNNNKNNSDNEDNNNNKKNKKIKENNDRKFEELTYNDIIDKYSDIFTLIIVYSYFSSKIKNLSIFKVTMPDCYEREIVRFLNTQNIILFDFNFLGILSNLNNLVQFTCDFDCLDISTFENVIGFIYNNENLKVLQLSFFPPEEHFSPQMLLKILISSRFNITSIFPKNTNKNSISEKVNDDIDILIINKLLSSFEENLTNFFALLEKKSKLTEISLLFDLPTIICNNSSYLMVLIKFFFNIFLLLQNNVKNQHLQSLLILAEYFNFDSRKYPIISEFLENVSLYKYKECILKKLVFKVRLFNIHNLYRLIPCNLTYLSFGELNEESFINLVDYLTSIEYNKISRLDTLKLSLANTIIDYDSIKDVMNNLMINYPKSIKLFSLHTFLNLNREELDELISVVNYNTLEKMKVEINKIEYSNQIEDEKSSKFILKPVNEDSDKDFYVDNCYYVARNPETTDFILNIMMNLKKINKDFFDFNIYKNLEIYLCKMNKKQFIIKTKTSQ